ncbi:MAG: ABC transporter permease [Bacteroidota bacterium]
MTALIKVFSESIAQAIQQLGANKLRSFLSLLGITIGIFCIIGVQSAVDSLEDNIRGSFEKLGNDVVYVSKFSWAEDPGQNYWKFMRHPNIDYKDFEVINKKVKSASLSTFHVLVGFKTAKYRSSSVDQAALIAITYDYADMFNFNFERGRYFSPAEYHYGAAQCVLGYTVAEELFGDLNPIGREIKLMGRSMEIIGVLERNGEDLVSVMNFDECIMVSYELGRKMANLKSTDVFGNSVLSVKAAEGIPIDQLKDEITGIMRAHRRLKPKEDNNFAMNELSLLSKVLDGFFGVLNGVGFAIGIFAIIVGVFSVANIMFVSVQERTNIIGIKKALGAKKYFILLEFLVEAIILCLIGGLVGLLLIFGVAKLVSASFAFEIFLSSTNIINGLIWSVSIGILSGLIPAFRAASMDPVDAMRS